MEEVIVSIQNLTKIYQTRSGKPPHFALKNVNLEVKRGDVYGIIGMSGAGKTTLMRLLTELESPTEGKILLDRGEGMGMIFQHFNLFSSRTVLDNVTFPLEIRGIVRETRKERALETLELVGLEEKKRHYPAQLSGGEKQRVAIARALVNNPSILLCDEATSALDPRTTEEILSLLSDLNQKLGLTILLITHEMDVIKQICTHVAVLEHGEIVEKGAVEELFAKPKHPTTERFLLNLAHEIPEIKDERSIILRLSFKGKTANLPIISSLIKQHAVEVNILLGGIDVLKTETIGNLVVQLSGEEEDRAHARLFLESQGVGCDELIR